MSLPICKFFLNGHCKLKSQCPKSHKILTCFLGPYCKSSSCSLRHPRNCENFLLNVCNYPSCNHFHPPAPLWYNNNLLPPTVHPPHHPPYHPPSHVPFQPTYNSELDALKTTVQQLVTVLESIKSNSQPQYHENEEGAGSAPCSPESDTENILSAPVDSHEKVSNTAPIKETKAQSNRTWWNLWYGAQQLPTPPPTSGAQEQKDLEIVPIQGECLEEVMLAQETKEDKVPKGDSTHRPPDDKTLEEELANMISKITAIETLQQEMKVKIEEVVYRKEDKNGTGCDNNTDSGRLKKLETDMQDLQEKVDIKTTVNTCVKGNFDNLMANMKATDEYYESHFLEADTRLSKLEDQFDTLKKNLNINSFITDLGETQTRVENAQQSLAGLESRLHTAEENIENLSTALVISDDKQAFTEAKNDIKSLMDENTAPIIDDDDDSIAKGKCNNCQSFPCLDKKHVTIGNFVNGAYFKGYLTSGHVHGYTQVNGLNNYQVKWIKFSVFPCTDFIQTQEFSANVESLKFSCKT